jgi:hypothetical protein
MFDVFQFRQSHAVPDAGAPSNCAKWHSYCATVTLLALLFAAFKTEKNSIVPFVYKASVPGLELRHRNCMGTGDR